ncbi:MAG: hypothetical protein ABI131_05965 [Nostocoides sp.]
MQHPEVADVGFMTTDGIATWFVDQAGGYVGRIDGAGDLTEWTVPPSDTGVSPNGLIVAGRIVWFTDSTGNRIGRLDPSTGTFTMYAVPTAGGFPLGITIGPDGNIWFLERTAGKVARMTPAGAFTEWGLVPGARPNRIVVGPDGALWFTELGGNRMGRITTSGHLTEFPVLHAPADAGGPVGLTVGPDGALYAALFTIDGPDYVARFDLAGDVTHAWRVPGALILATSQGAVWATDPFADTITRLRPQCRAPEGTHPGLRGEVGGAAGHPFAAAGGGLMGCAVRTGLRAHRILGTS